MAESPLDQLMPTTVGWRAGRAVWLRRLIAGGVLLAALAYATLPWWLPARWIAERLERELSAGLGRTVRIERASLGWAQGVLFEGLTVEGRSELGEPVLAKIDRLRSSFSPLKTLWTGRVDRLEVDGVALRLAWNAAGESNVSDLSARPMGPLPTHVFLLRDLRCTVQTPTAVESIRMDQVQCRLEPRTGEMRLLGEVEVRPPTGSISGQPPRRFSIHSHLRVAQLKRDVPFGGEIEIEWNGLSLRDLPLGLIPDLPIEQLEGTTSGEVTFSPRADLQTEFAMRIALNGVRVYEEMYGRTALLPDAELRGQGHWDPNTDVLTMRALSYETPGLRVAGPGRVGGVAFRRDPLGVVPVQVDVAGQVRQWARLEREWPMLARWFEWAGLSMQGGGEFTLFGRRTLEADEFTWTMQADGSGVRLSQGPAVYLSKEVDTPMRLNGDLIVPRDAAGPILAQGEWRLGACRWLYEVELQQSEPGCFRQALDWSALKDRMSCLQGQFRWETEDLAELGRLSPWLASTNRVGGWRGPADAGLSIVREAAGRSVAADLTLGLSTELIVPGWLYKPAGQPLQCSTKFDWEAGASWPTRWAELDVSFGTARCTLDADRARWEFRLDEPAAGMDISAASVGTLATQVPLRITGTEAWLSLIPASRFEAWGLVPPRITGELGLDLAVDVSWGSDAFAAQCSMAGVLDGLEIRWPEVLQKSAGESLHVAAVLRDEMNAQGRDRSMRCELHSVWGRLSGTLGRSVPVGGQTLSVDQWQIQMEVSDLAAVRRMVPTVEDRTRGLELSGAGTLSMTGLRAGQSLSAELDLDATALACAWTEPFPGRKEAGTPCGLSLVLAIEPDDSDSRRHRLTVRDGSLALAGVSLDGLHAVLDIDSGGPEFIGNSGTDWMRWLGELAVAGGSARGAWELRGGQGLTGLHPGLRDWWDQWHLEGFAAGEVLAEWDGRRFAARGEADLAGLAFTLSTDLPAVPTVRKSAGQSASLLIDVEGQPPTRDGALRASLKKGSLIVGRNAFSLSGGWGVPSTTEPGPQPDGYVAIDANVDDMAELLGLLPGAVIEQGAGGMHVSAGLTWTDGRPTLSSAVATFSPLMLQAGEAQAELTGRVGWGESDLFSDQLQWKLGESQGALSGRVRVDQDGYGGKAGLMFERLDVEDLLQRVASWRSALTQPAETRPADDARASEAVIAALNRTQLNLNVHIDNLSAMLPGEQPVTADAVGIDTEFQRGPVSMDFRALLDGGQVIGKFTVQTQLPEAPFKLEYRADNIQPGPLVDSYLRVSFPGMTATGPVTLIDASNQRLLPGEGELNHPVGQGELIIQGGRVVGRAAPVWMARIFPGLNLARYDFNYMHSWFDKTETGRVYHHMIYQGNYYNIYMIGHSDPDRSFDYEVGIDFLADFDSKYWAESGQGRVPLFRKTGLVDAQGNLIEERVNYMRTRDILETLLVRNNLVFIAYHAVRKQVRNEQ